MCFNILYNYHISSFEMNKESREKIIEKIPNHYSKEEKEEICNLLIDLAEIYIDTENTNE